ncbi:MAG: ATP-binding cassette domain-containing protein, partial [Coriobacteriales bacterium]|nr:ATP-binding cassette domain-containing protein [Coriobacteriales bacterium]
MSVLALKDVSYHYEGTTKNVLDGISAEFDVGNVYTIVGRSGSGKSTLLSLIAGLDICSGGAIEHKGTNLGNTDRDVYRAQGVGVVFQSFNLILNMTAIENIILAMCIGNSDVKDKKIFALDLLRLVGIDEETGSRKILKLS